MVMIAQPVVTLKEMRLNGEIEETLRQYGNFVKVRDFTGNDYRLFRREDPSLLSFFYSPRLGNIAEVAVVSYDEKRNQEILSELEGKLGTFLTPLATSDGSLKELFGIIDSGLTENFKEIFSRLVLS